MRKGFTLIEIMIVVAILAIMAAVVFPILRSYHNATLEKTCKATIARIGRASDSYWARYGKPPEKIADLVEPDSPFLKIYPECPFGGKYEIKVDSNFGFVVSCTAHDPLLHNVNAAETKDTK